jgi:NAD(P)-dependent dehydrogenase (short-subunit alcohol dehydrogenase family)
MAMLEDFQYSLCVPNYSDLAGKTVLLTGGANGIGKATVRAFVEQAARVEFCDLDTKAGQALEAELQGCRFTSVNLANEREIKRWIADGAKRSKTIDILVNNAATDPRIPLENITANRFDQLFAVNLKALFLATREVVPHMTSGSIVNLSSITYHTAPAKMSAYVATKGGVIAATRALARELGPRGIRVNTVSPGWIMTERQLREYVDRKTKQLIRSAQCIPELLQPEEIAEVILFLGSESSRAVTGQEILADRGWAHS